MSHKIALYFSLTCSTDDEVDSVRGQASLNDHAVMAVPIGRQNVAASENAEEEYHFA